MKIGTIIPVHNALSTFEKSLQSVLTQKLPVNTINHVFCVLNGNTCNDAELYEKIINSDPRVTLLKQPIKGIVPALNMGLYKAIEFGANFIARQDADDFWLPFKLEQQLSYFEDYPEVGVLGTAINLCDKHGNFLNTQKNPLSHEECLIWLKNSKNPIAHPSVMFRTELLYYVGGYEQLFPMAEDLHLWQKFSRVTRLANLPAVYVNYTAVHNPNYNSNSPIAATNVFNFLKEQKIG